MPLRPSLSRLAAATWVAAALAGCVQEVKLRETPDVIIDVDSDIPFDPSAIAIEVTPAEIDFGYVPEGVREQASVTVTNVGTEELEVRGFTLGGSAAFGSPNTGLDLVLRPGRSVNIAVDFLSTNDFEAGDLTVFSNDEEASSILVSLRGNGADGRAVGTPIDFGPVHVDETATLPWTIHNPGNRAVTLTAVSSDEPAFAVELVAPVTIEAGGSGEVELAFTPEDIVAYAGVLTIDSDARELGDPIIARGHGADDPVAVCSGGPNPAMATTDEVWFTGEGSSDPIDRPLGYQWTVIQAPAGSATGLETSDEMVSGPLIPDAVGAYLVELVVTNDLGFSSSSCVVEIEAEGSVPRAVCEASPAVVRATEDSFQLVGSDSFDPDGRPITARWTVLSQPVGAALGLSGAGLDVDPITPDVVGDYTFELVVTNDVGVRSAPCTTSVTATALEPIAVCQVTPNAAVATVDSFDLVGRDSYDPLGLDIVDARWRLLHKPPGSTLSLPVGSDLDRGPLLPDRVGDYVFELVVTNSDGVDSQPCQATARGLALAPIALCDVTPASVVASQGTVSLIGEDSYDPLGLQLTWIYWELSSTPVGSTANVLGGGLNRILTPDLPGDYTAQLLVMNSEGVVSAGCSVAFEATFAAPDAICSASPERVTLGQGSFDLIASASTDPFGAAITSATWSFQSVPAGSSVTMPAGGSVDRGPITPDVLGSYRAQVVVFNEHGVRSDPCVAEVRATAAPPVAVCDITPDVVTLPGGTFTLEGSASYDPNALALTEATWTFLEVPEESGVLSPGPSAALDVGPVAPDLAGTYTVQLVVTNSDGVLSDPCVATVEVEADPPTAVCSGAPLAPVAGTDGMLLYGNLSSDPGGRAIRGVWSMLAAPEGSGAVVPGGTSLDRGPILADLPGRYIAELIVVNDLGAASEPCYVSFDASDPGPVAVCAATPIDPEARVDTFQLIGSDSYDRLGRGLTAEWSFVSTPAHSQVTMPVGGLDRGPILPDQPGAYIAELVVTNTEGMASPACRVRVDATGELAPVAVCSSDPSTVVAVHETFELKGDTSYDPGGRSLITADWSWVSRPIGSNLAMPTGNALNRGPLTPDTVGGFVAQLVVTNDLGVPSAPCEATLTAEVNADLWVELSWETAEDIDLHLIRNNGARNSADDCHYRNCTGGLSWGDPGTADDPVLDIDDITGTGPENINISDPYPDIYRVTVHDYVWSGNFTGDNLITVKIYVEGILHLMDTRVMTDEGSWIDIADVDFRGAVPVVTPL